MDLEYQYDNLEDIPEPFRELYTERRGKFEFTGVKGIQTQANVDRLEAALAGTRKSEKELKEKLRAWGSLDPEEVLPKLDRIEELEAAAEAGGGNDEEAIQKRVDVALRAKVAPLERTIEKLNGELEEVRGERDQFAKKETTRSLHDEIRKAHRELKMRPEAEEDALIYGERIFERTEDGAIVTRDGVGVTPGLGVADHYRELTDKRPHWWPEPQGAGARGSGGRPGVPSGKDNPFSREGWNMTKQGEYLREHGTEKAAKLAEAAGTTIGAGRPPEPKN